MAVDLLSPYLSKLDQVWHSVHLITSAKLDCTDTDIVNCLEACGRDISFGIVESDSNDKGFTLYDKSVDREKRIEVDISQRRLITIGLGKAYDEQYRTKIYRKVFSIIIEKLNIKKCSLAMIDKSCRIIGKTTGNPENIFGSIIAGSQLAKSMKGLEISLFRPKLTYILDKKKKVVCSFSFESETSLEEIIAENCKKKQTFKIEFGIARLNTFYSTPEEFMSLMDSNEQISKKFWDGRILPNLMLPLISTLIQDSD